MSIPKIESVNPPSALPMTPNYRGGSFAPVPNGAGPFHDVRQGGEVKPGNFVPIKNGGQDR
jgi:hypothetical protein